jgi:hypothetical protein
MDLLCYFQRINGFCSGQIGPPILHYTLQNQFCGSKILTKDPDFAQNIFAFVDLAIINFCRLLDLRRPPPPSPPSTVATSVKKNLRIFAWKSIGLAIERIGLY